MNALENLIRQLSRLPGVGAKSATRMAYHLLKCDESYNEKLSDAIGTIKEKIHKCSVCGSYTETDPCELCSDPKRDHTLLCIVEQPQDVMTIQNSGIYNGMYHVLGGAIDPLNGVGPEDLSFRELRERIKNGSFSEVIIATNPTEEGDTTALYIRHVLQDTGITVSRLAAGLPIGGDLEYADRLTLARSIKGRVSF
ncbi:MAG: recombination mediator RecR [Bullifex sp.]|nr:recombination mediator RecR [Spirochaetales bacterium]MDD7009240.1 recombination mediator RecR [Spirochaetales bacterium]MDY3850509.1 recombination mediator RecR [Bullifex sp.]MDY4798026.1 recombination mediator RecR [Bullifex sp.]MDY5057451.1 recombination mediator RecR [Bullifex sp.]